MPKPCRPVFCTSTSSGFSPAKSLTFKAVLSRLPSSTTTISQGTAAPRSASRTTRSVAPIDSPSSRAGMTTESFILGAWGDFSRCPNRVKWYFTRGRQTPCFLDLRRAAGEPCRIFPQASFQRGVHVSVGLPGGPTPARLLPGRSAPSRSLCTVEPLRLQRVPGVREHRGVLLPPACGAQRVHRGAYFTRCLADAARVDHRPPGLVGRCCVFPRPEETRRDTVDRVCGRDHLRNGRI